MSESKELLSPVWTHLTDIVVEQAEGVYVYDQDGTAYLDFTSGIGVTNTGHCHPQVVRAIREQAGNVLHAQANIYYHPPLLKLAEELRTVMPGPLDSYFFSNSGAEAVEASIKLARQATGRPNIIVFQGSFHGRTIGTMSLTTSKTVYRTRYQPLMAGVFVAPYPYSYSYGWDDEATSAFCLREVERLLLMQTAPDETAAILVEPVLGEGGYVVPPADFLQALRAICDQHGILLIIDEVQAGFGRTGRFFAFEHFGVIPDIVVMAKGLASGLPLSGIAASRALMEKWLPGSHGGTYGGNALSCAAAVATIRVIRDDGLLDNTQARGEQLMDGLRRIQAAFPVIGDVRGLGLMVASEFDPTLPGHGKPLAKAVQRACIESRLLLLDCGPYGNVIRWIPPLVVSEEQIDQALGIFERAVASALDG
jgi:4-aminobutyrate aminotransferase